MRAKRGISMLLALVLILSVVPASVLAEEANGVASGYNGYISPDNHIVGYWEGACSSGTECTGITAPIYWSDEVPAGSPFEESEYEGVVFTGKYANYANADTWYPSWAEDGNMYSLYTDGSINGIGIMSIDGANGQFGSNGARTGQARIEGDDPMNLKVVNLGSMEQRGNGTLNGRYPSANLVYNGVWYAGSYLLTYNNQTADEGCDIWNWPQVEGFVGLRTATMQNWEEGMTITKADYPWNRYITQWTEAANYDENGNQIWVTKDPDGTDPLFGEFHDTTGEIRFGAPHFVDFGQNMEYAPVNEKGEKMAYLVGHGATQYGAFNSWVQGDAIFLARVVPNPETINDMSSWEFYGGRDDNGKEIWTKNFDEMEPIARWDSHMGNVAVTYNAPLDKYFMTYSRGIDTKRYDSVILEADELTGPYKMIHYLENFGPVTYFTNIPSKFISEDGKTMWLCSSGNFYGKESGDPAHSHYSMMLREFTLVEEGDEVPEQRPAPTYYRQTVAPASTVPAGATNIALTATASGSTTYPGYSITGIKDGNLGGYGATEPLTANTAYEWATHGQGVGAWAKLAWEEPQTIAAVRLFDRPNKQDLIIYGTLEFSDGTKVAVESLPDDGKTGRAVNLETPLTGITWVKYTVDSVGACMNIGLSEFEVYDKALEIEKLPGEETAENLALDATITTSSTMAGYPESVGLNDGVADGWPRNTSLEWRSNGQTEGAWVDLEWDEEQTVSSLKICQNKKRGERITGAYLIFNGDRSNPVQIDNFSTNEIETVVMLDAPKTGVKSIRLVVDDVQAGDENVNITEIYVYADTSISAVNAEGILEAELAARQNAALVEDSSASSDYAVRMQEANSTITFTAEEAWDKFAIVYRADSDADCTIQIGDGEAVKITLPKTENQWEEYPIMQAVTAGQSIVLTTPKAAGPILVDCLTKAVSASDEPNTASGINLALFKPVTATTAESAGRMKDYLTDGSQGSVNDHWGPLSTDTSPEVVIDLKAVFKLDQFVLKQPTNWPQPRVLEDVEILVSTDGVNYTTAIAKNDYTFDATADGNGNINTINVTGDNVVGRYVKIKLGSCHWWNDGDENNTHVDTPRLSEVEVYGEALDDDVVGMNLALNKNVDVDSTGGGCTEKTCIVNGEQGDKDIEFWTPNGSTGAVTVNLGQNYELTELVLKLPLSTSNWYSRSYDVAVSVSADGSNYTSVGEATKCTFIWSEGNTATISLPANTQGQYVKLALSNGFYITGNYALAPQLSELVVYGKLPAEPVVNENLAYQKPVTSNAEAPNRKATRLVDGSQGTWDDFWEPGTMNSGWVEIDLGSAYKLNQFVLKQPKNWPQPRTVKDIEILVSTDGVNYTTAIAKKDYTFDATANGNGNIHTINVPEGQTVAGRYVKINLGESYWWPDNNPSATTAVNPQLSEVEVYGEELATVTGIKLSKDSLTLKAWQTYDELTVALEPTGAVGSELSWSSSDISVAKVDSTGAIQAQGNGTCLIRVRPVDSVLNDMLTLTVTENNIESVDALEERNVRFGIEADDLALPTKVTAHLDGADLKLRVGQWTCESYDPEVGGTYTFTAPLVLPAGVTNSKNLTATIQLNVLRNVTGVTLNKTEITLEKGASETLDATVIPAGANDKTLAWASDDTDVATVDAAGKVTAMKKGSATITVTTTDGGETASCVVTVKDTAGDQAAADTVEAKITAIGDVTLDSEVAITDARAAYEALDEDQKLLVDNFSTLQAAEQKLEELKKEPGKPVDPSVPVFRPVISAPVVSKPAVVEKFPFTDVAESAWYYDEVKEAWENDLIDGMTATTFDPNGSLTVAQAIKLAAALHQMDKSGKVTLTNGDDVWYSTYVSYAIANGIIDETYGDYTWAQMNAAATRKEFVKIFHGAMDYYAKKNTVADNAIPDVKMDDTCADEIYAFYRAGILIGSDDAGTFYPNSNIKRSEVATILIRMYDVSARQMITLK